MPLTADDTHPRPAATDHDGPLVDEQLVDDPSLAELDQAVVEAEARLARALELEAQAWDNMRDARATVVAALAVAQRARERRRLLRANVRPA